MSPGEPPAAGLAFDLASAADIRFGAGRLAEVAQVVAGWGVRRVAVVTGRSGRRGEPVRAALAALGVDSVTIPVPGEPSVESVRAGLETVRRTGCGGVLGIGGGSALDTAKALAVLAGNDGDPLDHLEVVGAGRPFTRPALPWAAVPTTAGTGSEVTRNAVLSAEGVKASLRSPLMLARLAVVDPDLLVGCPPSTLAASGLDALSQLIEPFLSRRANPITDALAREGMTRSARSLRRAVEEGVDEQAPLREDLALASLAGGLCLANSGLGAVHGLAGPLGGRLAAPHGALCGALLPAVLEVNLAAVAERAPQHPVRRRFDEVAVLLSGRPDATAADGVAWVRQVCHALGVPGLGHWGLSTADVPAVVRAGRQASSMKANPVTLSEAELTEILRRSL